MRQVAGIAILGALGIGAFMLNRNTDILPDTVPGGNSTVPNDGRPATVRANNPGGILVTSDRWQGATGEITVARGLKMVVFSSPVWGARAMIRALRNSPHTKIVDIIQRWSGGENYVGYADYVARGMGMSAFDTVNMSSDTTAAQFAYHMAQWEAGGLYFDFFTFTEGAALA